MTGCIVKLSQTNRRMKEEWRRAEVLLDEECGSPVNSVLKQCRHFLLWVFFLLLATTANWQPHLSTLCTLAFHWLLLLGSPTLLWQYFCSTHLAPSKKALKSVAKLKIKFILLSWHLSHHQHCTLSWGIFTLKASSFYKAESVSMWCFLLCTARGHEFPW